MVSFFCGFSCCTHTREVTLLSVSLLKAISLFSTSTNNKSPETITRTYIETSVTIKRNARLLLVIYLLTRIVRHSQLFSVRSPSQRGH